MCTQKSLITLKRLAFRGITEAMISTTQSEQELTPNVIPSELHLKGLTKLFKNLSRASILGELHHHSFIVFEADIY